MNSETLMGMISNAAFLLALAVLYDALPLQKSPRRQALKILIGVLIGLIGMAVMLTPWRFSEGVIFDTRSILLSLTGYFFGFWPTLIATLMTGALRVFQGGSGALMGVSVILTSSGLGLAWRYLLRSENQSPRWYEFYGFGILVHLAMLLWTFALPREINFIVLKQIALPVILIYPLGTVLLGLLLTRQRQRNHWEAELRHERDLLARISETSLDAILLTAPDGSIYTANPAACQMFGRSEAEIIAVGRNGILDLSDPRLPLALEERARTGRFSGELTFIRRDGQKFPGEVASALFKAPAGYDRTSMIIRDITERKQAEENLRRRTHEAETLQQAAASLASSLDLNLVLDSLLSQLAQVVEYDSATVFLLQNERLLAMAGRGLPFPEKVIGQQFPASNELFEAMRKTGRPLILSDVQKDPRFQNWGGADQIHGWMGVPLVVHGELIGRLTIDSRKVDAYDDTHAKLALAFANQAAIAIQNARLYEQAQREIAERKQAEESLRVSEAFGKAILEHSPLGISVRSRTGGLISANEAWRKIWGMSEALFQEDLASQKPSLNFDERDDYLKAHHADLRRVYQQGGHLHLPTLEVGRPRPGGARWISQHFYALQDADGQVDKVVILTEDITQRKQAEEDLKEYNTRLEAAVEARTSELRETQEQLVRQEKLAVLGQLAGSVGHELRNPLGIINNAIYYLRLVQPNADETVREYLGIIETETHTADKIISDLLDFSRIKSVDLEPVHVSDLIGRTLERYPVPETVQLTLNLPENLPKLYVDPRQMAQVLGNLVVNACQAMVSTGSTTGVSTPSRGQAGLATDVSKGGDLTLFARKKGKMVAISVRDSGVGIPPENMQKLFEPLFTTKPKGIGLGLAVSQKLVEANGGRIEVESEVGVGTTLTVYLPISRELE
jgi:PAS domain S-box-containing protein